MPRKDLSFAESLRNIVHEVTPSLSLPNNRDELNRSFKIAKNEVFRFIHIPYFPAFHRPGWLLRYIVGPYDKSYFESMFFDITAGITVCLTLIPQGLSYAILANLPAINGLYASIMPALMYTLFGSSMQLSVGAVAVVSLLVGQLIANNAPLCSYTAGTSTNGCPAVIDPTDAINTAAQASLSVGVLLIVLSLFNFGSFINLIAKPVIEGFTCGAAMTIGLSQLKDALGFTISVPQAGQPGYDYNYEVMEWYVHNWDAYGVAKDGQTYSVRNPYAMYICFGIYIPMMFLNLLKVYLPAPPERKKTWWYNIFVTITNMLPLAAIVIGANIAWQIKTQNRWVDTSDPVDMAYANSLKIVGTVPAGLDIYRVPIFLYPFWSFLGKCVVIALILYMESYSVARRIATKRNELHIMNASQEMFANGLANFVGAFFSAFPVSGSFSRSSLNYLAGARTPLSKLTTLTGVIIALATLTETFYYIPKAALSAIIFVALFNLLCLEDIWEAFINSKRDFFVLITTLVLTFVFDTAIGLSIGIGLSLIVFLSDFVISQFYKPDLTAYSTSNQGVAIVRVACDLNFLTSARVKDFVSALTIREPPLPDTESSRSEYVFYTVSSTFDRWLIPDVKNSPYCKDLMPLAIVLDIESVLIVDLSGLSVLKEMAQEARDKNVKFVYMNVKPHLIASFVKYGIENDASNKYVNLSEYLSKSALSVRPKSNLLPVNPVTAHNVFDMDGVCHERNKTHEDMMSHPSMLIHPSYYDNHDNHSHVSSNDSPPNDRENHQRIKFSPSLESHVSDGSDADEINSTNGLVNPNIRKSGQHSFKISGDK